MFTPKTLSRDHVQKMFDNWLLQAEARALEAWTNYNLQPANKALKVEWEQAQENVNLLETERDRCLAAAKT